MPFYGWSEAEGVIPDQSNLRSSVHSANVLEVHQIIQLQDAALVSPVKARERWGLKHPMTPGFLAALCWSILTVSEEDVDAGTATYTDSDRVKHFLYQVSDDCLVITKGNVTSPAVDQQSDRPTHVCFFDDNP